ncbi:MAG: hypothetical protein AB7P00_24730 [Sandaracinaceae bacterium]
MSVSAQTSALRTRAAMHRERARSLLAMRGDDAQDALFQLCPSRLLLRDAQVKESLLLNERGHPIADVLVCADDEDYLLIVEGLRGAELLAHVEASLPKGARPELELLDDAHEILSVHGPWAWHVVASVMGDDLIALPYLNFFRMSEGLCVRAGKTGEYGYDVIVPSASADDVAARIAVAIAEVGGMEVDAATLALARFEAWFFDPAFVPAGVTPLELQLAWRLDLSREWVGSEAIAARRASGVTRRLMCMLAPRDVAAEASVTLDGEPIGEVVRCARSEVRDEHVIAALIDARLAHGGIDRYRIGEVPTRTVAPPLIDNHSLHVDPRRHTFAARDEIVLGPLARGPRAPMEAA